MGGGTSCSLSAGASHSLSQVVQMRVRPVPAVLAVPQRGQWFGERCRMNGTLVTPDVAALAQSVRLVQAYPACMSEAEREDTGRRVASRRRQAGLSQSELAQRLHRSVSWVQKIEQGTRELSDIRLIEELAAVLGVTRAELLGDDAEHAADMPPEEMQRRAFLQGLGTLTLTGENFSNQDLPYKTDAALLASLVEGTETLERLYGHVTPAALQGLVLGHLDALTALLRGAPGKYRREVLSLAGETAVLAGWVALDRGNDDRSLFYFDSALRAAADAGDTALSAYAMGSATTVPTFREKSPRSVINALSNGARGSQSHLPSAGPTAAWIATLEASAYASVGERDNALHALARAEDVFTASDTLPSARRPRVVFFDSGRLAGEQGIIRLELQSTRSDIAGRYLRTALIEIEPRAKIRARFLTALASIHADNGDVEGACRYAADAWRVGLETETVRSLDQVRELRRTKFAGWESDAAVRELDEIMSRPVNGAT